MGRKTIESIINDYFLAWSTKDMALYSSTLDFCVEVNDNKCETKTDFLQCEKSFEDWCSKPDEDKNFVVKDIVYDKKQQKATVFWELHTTSGDEPLVDARIMTVKFHKNKIKQLDQYSIA